MTGEGSNEYIFKELAIADMDNAEDYPGWINQNWINNCKNNPKPDGSFASLGIYGVTNIADISQGVFWNSNRTKIYSTTGQWGGKTQSQIKEAYPDLVVQFCLKLVTPEPFENSQVSIASLGSENKFFTNGENMDIIYKTTTFWG